MVKIDRSLSARRAWIEIRCSQACAPVSLVALRKESVDRNAASGYSKTQVKRSLSARRAWIEIAYLAGEISGKRSRSPQGERG